MISLIGNRPALQIGRYQVIDYDTAWLDDALKRAALAAEHEDFPFIADIRRKSFVVGRDSSESAAGSAHFVVETAECFATAAPFMRFLCNAVDVPM